MIVLRDENSKFLADAIFGTHERVALRSVESVVRVSRACEGRKASAIVLCAEKPKFLADAIFGTHEKVDVQSVESVVRAR